MRTRYFFTLLVVCSLIAFTFQRASAEIARGFVFEDANQNGELDADERGLPKVLVSNGQEIVVTDETGKYQIEIDDDTILFVIKPRGWMTATDPQHLPKFYYIHKPKGSPDEEFIYPGVEPTGSLPESVDFGLTKLEESAEYSMIMMGDPQPYTKQEVRYYANDTLAELIDTHAVMGMSLGDVVGDDLSLFQSVNAVQGLVGVPWYNVLGNHDMNFNSPNDKYSDETYERVYGPANYAFQYGQVHFVVLDNVYWKGRVQSGRRNDNYEGRLTDSQLGFVENYLQYIPQDDLIVICTHIPLPEIYGQNTKHRTQGLDKLLNLLSKFPNTLSFSAHTHFNHHGFLGHDHGYTNEAGHEHHHHNVATGSGSWYRGPKDEQGFPIATMADGAPNGYIIATFTGNKYRLRYKASRMPEDFQIAVYASETIPSQNSGEEKITANVFNGNKRSKVKMRVRGQTDWIPMKQTPGMDPAFLETSKRDIQRAREQGRDRHLPEPKVTKHIWTAKLGKNIPVGMYVLEVQSTDMFGQIDRGIRIIEVE